MAFAMEGTRPSGAQRGGTRPQDPSAPGIEWFVRPSRRRGPLKDERPYRLVFLFPVRKGYPHMLSFPAGLTRRSSSPPSAPPFTSPQSSPASCASPSCAAPGGHSPARRTGGPGCGTAARRHAPRLHYHEAVPGQLLHAR